MNEAHAVPTIVPKATFVYRGQLGIERSRIEFLLEALCAVVGAVEVLHLSPGLGSSVDELRTFTRQFPRVTSTRQLPGSAAGIAPARRAIRQATANGSPLMAVGFSVWPFVARQKCDVWCINGIPEERLLSRNSLVDRLATKASWLGARAVRPTLTVPVSTPMEDLLRHRLAMRDVMVVPNAVDLTTFEARASETPTYLAYQGGGSPWQGLDRLAEVWGRLHALDPSLEFRVISRDPRTRVLASALPTDAIDFTAAEDADGVAQLLSQVRLGFLFRDASLVNRVSWPMKMGEYLAAGAPVVVTDAGWDLATVVREHNAGLVVSWDDPAEVTARQIQHYLHAVGDKRPPGVASAAAALDALLWREELSDQLANLFASEGDSR